MKIALLLTGNELMSGDTVDSNSAYIAQAIKDYGLVPSIKMVVGDDLNLLVEAIESLSQKSDIVVVNGGLGPTRDDLTALALSKVSGRALVQNAEALAHLKSWAEQRNFILTESNLKQAELPDGCDVLDNKRGSAVGFSLELNNSLIVCTPGVPSEFKFMVDEQLVPVIKTRANVESANQVTRLRVFGITESGLQDMINESFPEWPAEVDLGFRVQMPVIEVKLTTQHARHSDLNQRWTDKFCAKFSDYIIGREGTRLTQALNRALFEKKLVMTTAESCTGGAIAAGITSEAGSSEVFSGGFVVYSNAMKHSLLAVSERDLAQEGAVSKTVVEQMATGALKQSGADVAIAISGIAGPTGGTEEKPVGTVWMAWGMSAAEGREAVTESRKFFFPMSRLAFQRTSTAIAMDLVRRFVLGLDTQVDYFSELKRK